MIGLVGPVNLDILSRHLYGCQRAMLSVAEIVSLAIIAEGGKLSWIKAANIRPPPFFVCKNRHWQGLVLFPGF